MKISAFHLMPHRELPPDFEKRYESVWVTPPWWELADARRVGQYYNWTLDELQYAAKVGFDGVCTNEHHQNAYGFMPSPNLMGSVLARATNGTNVAIVQMGATLPTSNPPLRVAEEYAMLDCISTFDFAVEHDVCYCFLSYSGARSAKTMMDGYWRVVADKGRDLNPYRAGFLQLVVVAENDARAEEKYARHVEYFYHKCLHV